MAAIASGLVGGIISGVAGLVSNNSNDQNFRNGWTQSQLGPLATANPNKNIMIVFPPHDQNFTRSQYSQLLCKTPSGQTLSYDCYVFDAGDFTLKGDGGFLNWAFQGNFTRNGNKVTFKKPGSKFSLPLFVLVVAWLAD